ncbi:unnamed protein product [Adineta steineri]|uniref:K Homology domain-containing protein n=1 Tax=Adineta steineri TaxID=433720 RepID=A0A815RPM3_9BILA|nr:unnamed protein product [Adineta steineri]CAF1638284.1 unnamed protein product [Adineta steineri]
MAYNKCIVHSLLEPFKIITVTDGCIVHNSKYQSKFKNAISLIRRGKKYKNSIYYELPKRCCSCNGKKGLNVIDLNVLINICDEISLVKERIIQEWKEANIEPIDLFEPYHFLSLLFESEISLQERRRKIGRFIGKNGQHIRDLQDKYNIRIQIEDQSSSRKIIQKKFAKIQDKDKLDKLYLLITNKNKIITKKIRIDMIEEDINKLWEKEEEINDLNHNRSSELNF